MNPVETHEITELIGRLREEGGYTILVIEHDMHVVEGISDRVVALDHGVKIAEGDVRPGRDRPEGRRGLPGDVEQGARVTSNGRPEPLLRLEGINTYYGQMHILQDVNLEVGEGELVCLLGGNASGKSTTLKTILGIVPPRSGSVVLGGEDVTRHSDGSPDRVRARHRPGESSTLRSDDRARESRDGRIPPAAGRSSARTSTASSRRFRCSPSAASSLPGRCPAASSRWSRWGGR